MGINFHSKKVRNTYTTRKADNSWINIITNLVTAQILIGVVSFFVFFVIYLLFKYLLSMSLSGTSTLSEFAHLLEADAFHPVKLISIVYFIGPLTFLVGGILHFLNFNDANDYSS